jgi:hypothetical protein
MKKKNTGFSSFYCFNFTRGKYMFAALHLDINSLKSGLLHLTGQPYCKKSRPAKVKDGNVVLLTRFLGTLFHPPTPPLTFGNNSTNSKI